MIFGTDEQTRKDLNIFSKNRGDLSIFDYYNRTKTKGGCFELEYLVKNPSSDLSEIHQRMDSIRYILNNQLKFEFDKDALDFIEHYLNQNTEILRDNLIDSSFTWVKNKLKPSNDYYIIMRGLVYLKEYIQTLSKFIDNLNPVEVPALFKELTQTLDEFRALPFMKQFFDSDTEGLSSRQMCRLDSLIRVKEKGSVLKLLKLTYHLDAYMSVSEVSEDKALAFPKFVQSDSPYLKLDAFFHPFLEEPVTNNIEISDHDNLCFVSGANMAGKSTFLKSIGVCLYLAHIGFPVPASAMTCSVLKGLYSTINISDDIEKGYSHYYSEVKRVKEVVLRIKEEKNVFVLFDELFRGTNVQDAYDATLMVTSGFVKIKTSLFFVSTHIVEVGQELEKLEGTCFKCFRSHLEDGKPKYDYILEEGISAERLGLTIVENEKIMETIDEIVNESSVIV